jgi:hypothetical protein
VPSLALYVEPAHYASFDATLASRVTDDESKSLGPLYGTICHELHSIASSTLPWVVHLRAFYAAISRTDGFSDVDLALLAITLN